MNTQKEWLGRVGTQLAVRCFENKRGKRRVFLASYDYGPITVLAERDHRQLWRIGGYTTYSGRRSMTVAEYVPVEWWLVESREGNMYEIVAIHPPQRRSAERFLMELNAETHVSGER